MKCRLCIYKVYFCRGPFSSRSCVGGTSAETPTGENGVRDHDDRPWHVGHRRQAVGTAGRRDEHWRDLRGNRSRDQLGRYGADLWIRTLGGGRRPRAEARACVTTAAGVHKIRSWCECRRAGQVCRRARSRRGVRGQPAPAGRRSDRSLPVALASAAADRRDGRRVREAAGGGKDSRNRRFEFFRRSDGGMDRDRCAAALGPAAVQHSAAGGG